MGEDLWADSCSWDHHHRDHHEHHEDSGACVDLWDVDIGVLHSTGREPEGILNDGVGIPGHNNLACSGHGLAFSSVLSLAL